MKRFFFPFLLCLVGLVAGSCNDEDDMDIFVGRTWKVGNLFGASNRPVLNEEQAAAIAKDGTFYLIFENRTDFKGRTLDKNFSGTWSADLKERTISLHFKDTGNPSDALSKMVISSIQKAVSYEGDYNQLKLKEAGTPYILFHP